MTFFHTRELNDLSSDLVHIQETEVGKGVFALGPYPATAIIGEITGDVIENATVDSEYSFEIDDIRQLEPYAPFRYLNHSCDPNCEFDLLDEGEQVDDNDPPRLYLIALRDIEAGEQLTIAYNWPASCAIECKCGSEDCVGWIVCEEELDHVLDRVEQQIP